MKNWGGHFTPELGAHFKLELGGQYHRNMQCMAKPNFAQKQYVLFYNANFPGILDIRMLKFDFLGI